MVTKELAEMQAWSSMYLQQFELVITERSQLYNDLQEHQVATILECEAEQKRHMQELEEACTEFSHEVDKLTTETKARV